jgi:Ca2+-binding RTX toxin-like protein
MALLVVRAATVALAAGGALMLGIAPAVAAVSATTDGTIVTIESDDPGDPAVNLICQDGVANVDNAPAVPELACSDVTIVIVDAQGVNGEGGATTVNLGGVTELAFPSLLRTSVDVADVDDDTVTGSEGRDVVNADPGDEVTGGLGDDLVEGAGTAFGGQGNDVLRDISSEVQGGAGDDRIVGLPVGPVSGGDGHDVFVQDYTTLRSQQPVNLAISDSRLGPPGFGMESTGIEQYDITTSTGFKNDVIDSSAYSGVVHVETLDGNDTVRGGPGADVVEGGAGNDVLDPGPGADIVRGGSGNDTISVRDGVADSVDCGDGFDTVVADRSDVLVGCESVSLPPPETNPIVGPQKVKKGKKPAFTFGSPAAGAQFECAIDAGPYKPCESPFHVKTNKLPAGKHTLSVRAIQPAGNADPTPSTFRFKVLPKKK